MPKAATATKEKKDRKKHNRRSASVLIADLEQSLSALNAKHEARSSKISQKLEQLRERYARKLKLEVIAGLPQDQVDAELESLKERMSLIRKARKVKA